MLEGGIIMTKTKPDALKNKKFKSVANNVYHIPELRRMIVDPEIDVQYRQTVVATIGGEFAAMSGAIIGLIASVNIPMSILAILAALQTPLVFVILGIIIGEKDGHYAKYIATLLYILELPIIFCFSGGYNGPGLYWFLFSVMIASLVCPRREAFLEVIIACVIQLATLIITKIRPELIFSVNPDNARINSVLSVFAISIAIFVILYLQKSLSNANSEYLQKLKAETDSQNRELIDTKEELIANNEEITAINEELLETSSKLSASLDEKQRALEQQRRFTAMLNHELRNPLNGIMGHLQLQLMNDELPLFYKKELQDSYILTESMLQTVNDILDFSKMQEGKFEIIEADFGLNDIIHNIHTIFDEVASNKGLNLVYDTPEHEYTLFSDGIRIQQIIVNLMSNSVKYTEKGKVSLEINVDEDNSSLDIRISDTGRGMTEDEVAYIFEPYKRFDLEQNKKIQGTGLGMSIVKNLMDQLDGVIKIQSTPGQGTSFILSIPVVINKVTFIKKVASDNLAIDLTGKVILAVDDDSINLKILTMFLDKTSAVVITAKNGREALNIVESGECKIDCIVTDNLMPEMTGCDFKMYMNQYGIRIPTIVLTGNTDPESIEKFKSLGFDGILPKPVIHNSLISCLKELIK